MKVKLYELLTMLYENKLKNDERIIIDDRLYKINIEGKYFIDDYCNRLNLNIKNLDTICELIDRKEVK